MIIMSKSKKRMNLSRTWNTVLNENRKYLERSFDQLDNIEEQYPALVKSYKLMLSYSNYLTKRVAKLATQSSPRGFQPDPDSVPEFFPELLEKICRDHPKLVCLCNPNTFGCFIEERERPDFFDCMVVLDELKDDLNQICDFRDEESNWSPFNHKKFETLGGILNQVRDTMDDLYDANCFGLGGLNL
ncbi:MAG: hypothetical protein HeimC2_10850 [Candidatus Heimdallarchaeota archaeon LC_2]|nr:MAG: hypothetical protein HeimC2_10850 [Candidatus Heimdallarchaeota archaeon LC_2]